MNNELNLNVMNWNPKELNILSVNYNCAHHADVSLHGISFPRVSLPK